MLRTISHARMSAAPKKTYLPMQIKGRDQFPMHAIKSYVCCLDPADGYGEEFSVQSACTPVVTDFMYMHRRQFQRRPSLSTPGYLGLQI